MAPISLPPVQYEQLRSRQKQRTDKAIRSRKRIRHSSLKFPSSQQQTTFHDDTEDKTLILDHNMESGSDEEPLGDEHSSMPAYQALLQSLQAKGGNFARAYSRRQKEEEGMSSSEDSDDAAEHKELTADREGQGGMLDNDQKEKPTIMSEQTKQRGDFNDSESQEESENDEAPFAEVSQKSAFKKHLEHGITEQEAVILSERKVNFKCQTHAVAFQEATWITTACDFPTEEKTLANYGVKVRLRKNWISTHKNPLWGDFETHQQCQLFSLCNSYRDILLCKRPSFHTDGNKKDAEVLDAYLLHLINHILQTRDLVTKNNNKMTHQVKHAMPEHNEVPRDQGFTRPKVLMLVPLRSSALRVVKRMLDLVPSMQKATVEHKERFLEEFGVEDEALEDEAMIVGRKSSKPSDFHTLFGGNNDDHFRMGIKFTRKSVKLYSDFYSSDVIIASPLGLITRIGEAENEKDKDVDFLSSIEILVIDYANVIVMQNWSHVLEISKLLNQLPTQQHGADFMRIREWILNGQGRYYRQTIILSTFTDAGMNAFFHRSCYNFSGKIKLHCEYQGVLSKVLLQVRQVYERVNVDSLTEVDDARFELFTKQVFSTLKDSLQTGIMIFVSSYFDFVRLRNFLKLQNMSFCLLGEYTKQSDISRARAWFFHGKRQILLYTERAHFYHRYKIRGIKDLIFYSLPEHEEFYTEITNMMEGLENPSSIVIFSQFDKLKLERVVGTSRANRMLSSESKTFMFC